MLDFGAGEFVVVGVVALIAIGPKELPGVLRTIGRSIGKMRRMAGDFQNQFNDAMREMELEEARKKVEEMGKSVSESVQAATHVDMSSDPLTQPATSGETTTATAATHHDTSLAEPPSAPDASSSVLGPLPDIHAPSADQLLAQAQHDVLSSPTIHTPVASEAPHEEAKPAQITPSADTPTVSHDQTQGKGTSV